MKYILLFGKKDDGKSTTIDAVCKALNPSRIQRLVDENYDGNFMLEDISLRQLLHNSTYLLTVENKTILVVSGSPTEQGLTITRIFDIFISFRITIDFALVTRRTNERKIDSFSQIKFDTVNELFKYGTCILHERIHRMDNENFKETDEWKKRIKGLVALIKDSLFKSKAA